MAQARRAPFGEHKDAEYLQLFPVPLVILATNWDATEPIDGEQKKSARLPKIKA